MFGNAEDRTDDGGVTIVGSRNMQPLPLPRRCLLRLHPRPFLCPLFGEVEAFHNEPAVVGIHVAARTFSLFFLGSIRSMRPADSGVNDRNTENEPMEMH